MNAPSYTNWTPAEVALLDRIVATGRDIRKRDLLYFPNRTEKSIVRKASLRRKALGMARRGRGDHRHSDRGAALDTFTSAEDTNHAIDAQTGSGKLLRAIVAMCIRNDMTLPGASAGHTKALAKNLGVIA